LRRSFEPSPNLDAGQLVCIIQRLLVRFNPSLGRLCCGTAFIATSIAMRAVQDKRLSLRNLILLSLLHLMGAYRHSGESPVEEREFSAQELRRNNLYSYFYLKELSPVAADAKALLLAEQDYDASAAVAVPQMEYASLIFASQKLMRMIEATGGSYSDADFEAYRLAQYSWRHLEAFRAIDRDGAISRQILDGSFMDVLFRWCRSLRFDAPGTDKLRALMIHLMDYKSSFTVQHTVHTAGYAVALGKQAGCSDIELNELFTAGLCHDLGKISIPNSILESTERLLPWEYRVMKMHVSETERILDGIVPKKIFDIAVRHHEKLDGSGYPYGLTERDLTVQQRILAVADIMSALADSRSYKGSYSKGHVIKICKEMTDSRQIDSRISVYISAFYEQLQHECAVYSALCSIPLGRVEMQFQEALGDELSEQIA
ncbi:MAG: HD domain-containing protein, partial [Treponemataceae bacterium]|nr:HD domain-containing protein [Treponemataceae bacterium]